MIDLKTRKEPKRSLSGPFFEMLTLLVNGMREPVPGTFGTVGSFSSNLVHFEIGTKYKIGTGTKNRTKIVEDF